MSEQDENAVVTRAAEALGISSLVPAIYQELLGPSVRLVGERLVVVAKAVCIGLAPFEGMVWGYERIRSYLAASVTAKLASKPAEEIQPPDPTLAGPILQRAPFTVNSPSLREMYAQLLARTMHTPSARNVHPSFATVVEQLSPADAHILNHISTKYRAGWEIQRDEIRERGLLFSDGLAIQWRHRCAENGILDTAVADAIYFNLVRVGIFIERTEPIRLSSTRHVQDDSGSIRATILTSYGDQFLSACVRELAAQTTDHS